MLDLLKTLPHFLIVIQAFHQPSAEPFSAAVSVNKVAVAVQ
jgi:hypothetical protein